MIYNTLLRALGKCGGIVGFGPFGGQDVRGCFVTSVHAMNNGNVKLARLSVPIEVHRGIANMKLPEQFLHKDADGERAGVELAFMYRTPAHASHHPPPPSSFCDTNTRGGRYPTFA